MDAAAMEALLRIRRRKAEPLRHATFGRFALSDNAPLSEAWLSRCLDDGLTAADWIGILNGYVFFWARPADVRKLRNAQNNRLRAKALLVFDTLTLVRAHAAKVAISPINSGATLHQPPRRGLATFAPLTETDFKAWRRRRKPSGLDAIKEIVVKDGVPDAGRYLVEVIELNP